MTSLFLIAHELVHRVLLCRLSDLRALIVAESGMSPARHESEGGDGGD